MASASVPRSVAFEVFIGTTGLTSGIASEFISMGILAIAGIL